MDPDDVGGRPVLGALRAVEVELLPQRGVGEQRRHGHPPAVLRRKLVGAVGRAAEVDAELALREGDDVRVVDVEVGAVMREALAGERLEEQVDCLLVARSRILVERHSGLRRDPAVPPADAEFVAAAGEDVGSGDRGGQHERVVVRQGVQHRAERDRPRALRGRREEGRRVAGNRELREEEVLDGRVGVVAEPVRVDHLLEHLGVELLGRLAVLLDLRVDAEPHRLPVPRRVVARRRGCPETRTGESAMIARSLERCQMATESARARSWRPASPWACGWRGRTRQPRSARR